MLLIPELPTLLAVAVVVEATSLPTSQLGTTQHSRTPKRASQLYASPTREINHEAPMARAKNLKANHCVFFRTQARKPILGLEVWLLLFAVCQGPSSFILRGFGFADFSYGN